MRKLKYAVGYVSVSGYEPGEEAFDIDTQKKEILMYADENDYSIVDWKIDESSDKPALNSILNGDEVGYPVEAVIAFRNDRVEKDTKLYFYDVYVLEMKNVNLLSTTEKFPEGDNISEPWRELMQFMAEKNKGKLATRTSKGRKVKASKGEYAGGKPPFGYKAINHHLEIDPEEAEIVKTIFKMKDDEGKTYKQVVEWLNDSGYTNRRGGEYSISSVQSIYENKKTYQGFYKYGKDGEWVQGVHEPILKGAHNGI